MLARTHPLSDKDAGFAAALSPKWDGPYTIKQMITRVTYRVVHDITKEIKKRHVWDLKPFVEIVQFVKYLDTNPINVVKGALRNVPRVDYRKLNRGK